jgi:hypothetical protein
MVNAFPENRFFAVIYTTDAVLLTIALLAREFVIKSHDHGERSFLYSLFVFGTIPLIALSMALVSAVTLGDSRFWHLLPATIMLVGLILYFIVSDSRAASAGLTIGRFSRALPYYCCVAFAIYSFILAFFLRSPFVYSIGSLFQYLLVVGLFLKVYLAGSELPDATFALMCTSRPSPENAPDKLVKLC